MKAIVISSPGGPEVLTVRDVPTPQPAADQVLVRVRAAGLNRADLLQRAGHYPAPPGFPQNIPGLEFAGEVAELGPDARLWKPGQRVFGITGGGAYAEFIVVHERTLAEIPPNLDWIEAASIPEVFMTAHDAMWKQAALRPCETVLVHAVGSGVGLAAVQLARAIGAVPYGTSRSHDKLQRAREYGMEDGIDLREGLDPLQAAVDRWTGGRGINVVMEIVGGSYIAASIRAMAQHGRMIVISSSGGPSAQLDLLPLMTRRLTIRGTTLRSRPLEEKIAVTRAFADEVVPLFARGVLRTVIDAQFPLEQAAAGHARLESNQSFGKVVLRMD
jgi:NADPH2:quinone reductase